MEPGVVVSPWVRGLGLTVDTALGGPAGAAALVPVLRKDPQETVNDECQ